mmetsp:Transcript_37949/g.100994  ORF Transcript_37949/g.100994 Transcript_37949/m.100994 type:complete len:211 (-) Transcript_37949:1793-2425(-)
MMSFTLMNVTAQCVWATKSAFTPNFPAQRGSPIVDVSPKESLAKTRDVSQLARTTGVNEQPSLEDQERRRPAPLALEIGFGGIQRHIEPNLPRVDDHQPVRLVVGVNDNRLLGVVSRRAANQHLCCEKRANVRYRIKILQEEHLGEDVVLQPLCHRHPQVLGQRLARQHGLALAHQLVLLEAVPLEGSDAQQGARAQPRPHGKVGVKVVL